MTAPTARTRGRTILLYAQDSRGMGHITRTLTIARHLLARHPTLVAYVATKSPVASNFTLPERCDYIKLPTRLMPAATQYTPDEEEAEKAYFRVVRGTILRAAALGLAPQLVLVDHEPLGAKGEFRDGLCALKAASPGTRFVCGLRDIMDDPEHIRALWEDLGVYDALETLYDDIAVYGSPTLYDVAEAYAMPDSLRPKLHYCGYIVRSLPAVDPTAVRREHGLAANCRLVVATVGSGSDGYPVLDAALAGIERLRSRVRDLQAILVTGPYMPAAERADLRARATPACRVLEGADNCRLMAAADAVVGMGGYNSVSEALALARPLVIVPRATHKVEQRIRAETLAARGLAQWVHPSELDSHTLADALGWALRRDPRAHARRVHAVIPSFDGAARLAARLSPWLARA